MSPCIEEKEEEASGTVDPVLYCLCSLATLLIP